jgi:uncharacterized NAD(P)/FAD-binding protein YdhS
MNKQPSCDTRTWDLVVVGGGLCGGRVVVNLLEALCECPRRGAPLEILVLDPRGEFGCGIPFGKATTQPGFLLIESVVSSTPPRFQEWLRTNRGVLTEPSRDGDPLLDVWREANRTSLASGDLDGLFVPRRVFGQFAAEELHRRIGIARELNVANVQLLKLEAIDVTPGSPLEVPVRDGRRFRTRAVVLAIGCIPVRDRLDVAMEDGYVHELYGDAFEGLAKTIQARSRELGRQLHIVLIGSGASAMEVIYHLAHTLTLVELVGKIEVISPSGRLAGSMITAEGELPMEPARRQLAEERTSARDYVEAAVWWIKAGKLLLRRGAVVGGRRTSGSGLEVDVNVSSGALTLTADVVVNCASIGNLAQTSSTLLSTLASSSGAFQPNHIHMGFRLRPNSYEVDGVENCFVIGPLLNLTVPEDFVQSIEAAYRVASNLGRQLHSVLTRTSIAGAGAL